jgi:hypothetical protein
MITIGLGELVKVLCFVSVSTRLNIALSIAHPQAPLFKITSGTFE